MLSDEPSSTSLELESKKSPNDLPKSKKDLVVHKISTIHSRIVDNSTKVVDSEPICGTSGVETDDNAEDRADRVGFF